MFIQDEDDISSTASLTNTNLQSVDNLFFCLCSHPLPQTHPTFTHNRF